MNRIEFMTELAALLQDVPVVERQDAMKYYNDYFDDAGEENEQQVIEELGSPAKVASTIKADLGVQGASSQNGRYGEYSETGYTDTRFDSREVPASQYGGNAGGTYQSAGDGGSGGSKSSGQQEAPRTSPVLKAVMIIAIILIGGPVIIPCAFAVLMTAVVLVFAVFLIFLAIVAASAAVAVSGLILFIAGVIALIPEIAVGLALIGTGLILGVLGVIGTVAGVRLCIIVFPGICRGIVWVCRWPFQRKAVV